jgi:hypothetical protein
MKRFAYDVVMSTSVFLTLVTIRCALHHSHIRLEAKRTDLTPLSAKQECEYLVFL